MTKDPDLTAREHSKIAGETYTLVTEEDQLENSRGLNVCIIPVGELPVVVRYDGKQEGEPHRFTGYGERQYLSLNLLFNGSGIIGLATESSQSGRASQQGDSK